MDIFDFFPPFTPKFPHIMVPELYHFTEPSEGLGEMQIADCGGVGYGPCEFAFLKSLGDSDAAGLARALRTMDVGLSFLSPCVEAVREFLCLLYAAKDDCFQFLL